MSVKFRDEGEMIVKGPSVRPRDASSLILIRREGREPSVLMGKRAGGHAFMPNKFVFPGGRVDAGDARVNALDDLSATTKTKLMAGCPNASRAKGLAMAAIRETFEEAGVIIGGTHDGAARTKSTGWSDFYRTGHLPQLAPLRFIFRAITPPLRPRRFDTRFFMVFDDEISVPSPEVPTGSGELVDLDWIPLTRVHEFDLPSVTQTVLREVNARLNDTEPERPVPFVRFMNGKPIISEH